MRLNWLAILVAAIAQWLLGAVWFTAFQKQWTAGLRMPPDELQAYMNHPNFWPYIISFLCNLVIAYAIARLLSAYEGHGLFRGISVGILIGLVAAVAMITEMAFEARARSFMAISAGYPLVGSILMGLIIGVWRPKANSSLSDSANA
jgi:uncharacterized membrane protein